jgi:uncharacterized membrane protein YfcA
VPVYLATEWRQMLRAWPFALAATTSVIIGTALESRVLRHLRPEAFRIVIAVLMVTLGLYMVVAGPG